MPKKPSIAALSAQLPTPVHERHGRRDEQVNCNTSPAADKPIFAFHCEVRCGVDALPNGISELPGRPDLSVALYSCPGGSGK
jgi:hypothetical protein